MAEHDIDIPPPTHNHGDEVPRGGRWAVYSAISVASAVAIAIAPQILKVPLGALSVLTLILGVGMLLLKKE
jgi:hypothetical protein